MIEKVIGTKDIFDGRIVHLKVHDVELPDGTRSKREVVHHGGAAAVVATDDQNRVLMVQQYRIAVQHVMWEIPAGTLEDNEPPQTCAIRELQEETGYKPIDLLEIGAIHVAPGYTTERIHIYWSREQVKSELPQDVDEFVESEWKPISDVLDMIADGDITDSKTVVGILSVARRLKI